MKSLVPEGAVVEFRTDDTWNWVGFDGCLSPSASVKRIDHEGSWILVDLDLLRLARQLDSKQYSAVQLDDLPGSLLNASITIEEATLCERTFLEDRKAVTTETRGRFSMIVVKPSWKASEPPVRDPMTEHQGTWSIKPFQPRRTTLSD